ncbi:hypothetical protein T069G_09413 [Trichoderma breve]|uniref:BRCT domain-containing protein n=1 Tax=Trichoderma breve TaxID=2034170 RepID=A0A9W9B4J6_9HYPO|nr:hypothetical protein T069G_09413 [Trichoderma breve]KAJ4856045.1 hypothetical protein T069G_09413 [Trichoderma breve]
MSPPKPLSRISATRPWDPWNSSATGHQRAETQPGTGWRHSRTRKLNSQFRAGDGSGGQRLSDTWGAGAENPDVDGKNTRTNGLMRETLDSRRPNGPEARDKSRRLEDEEKQKKSQANPRKLFDGVTVYVNGSTFPLVSDHRLKQLISENGGNMSLNLGRRKVTHVILGRPNGSTEGKGTGGGLAAGKLEKEIRKIGGCGVKFVSVEWVLQSLQEGKRLPEARFSNLKMAAKAQNSVYGLYFKQNAVSKTTPSETAS